MSKAAEFKALGGCGSRAFSLVCILPLLFYSGFVLTEEAAGGSAAAQEARSCRAEADTTVVFQAEDSERGLKCPDGWKLEPSDKSYAYQEGSDSEKSLDDIFTGRKLNGSKPAFSSTHPAGGNRKKATWYYRCIRENTTTTTTPTTLTPTRLQPHYNYHYNHQNNHHSGTIYHCNCHPKFSRTPRQARMSLKRTLTLATRTAVVAEAEVEAEVESAVLATRPMTTRNYVMRTAKLTYRVRKPEWWEALAVMLNKDKSLADKPEAPAKNTSYVLRVDELPAEQQALCYKCVAASKDGGHDARSEEAAQECRVKIAVSSSALSPSVLSAVSLSALGFVALALGSL
ncbi:hypothetical protein BESB_081940 [Besnoitia besnoiti]|uniref:SRS domain-containing protein n=1 Tax=Besnoitia besnoiti TaxID=94643 RepID=A0A2A9M4V4_BESBE|nr:hypothetical protein BESB_081940 [Besnoitia besnoiti]PFH32995.1 hypothetical protein BESB_081940 [Besnoitia besnoiti]